MATWQDFIREAGRFWDVARMVDGPGYENQAVSNAILAVIAANDALCLFLHGERAQGQSHAEARAALKTACRGTELEAEAAVRAQQLSDVLQQKHAAQYYGRPIGREAAGRAMKQAERFIGWVNDVLPKR